MSNKKFSGVLKGLAAAGIVTGGAGIIQDTDVVFAAENDEINEQDDNSVKYETDVTEIFKDLGYDKEIDKAEAPEEGADQNPETPEEGTDQKTETPEDGANQNPETPEEGADQNPETPEEGADQNPETPEEGADQNQETSTPEKKSPEQIEYEKKNEAFNQIQKQQNMSETVKDAYDKAGLSIDSHSLSVKKEGEGEETKYYLQVVEEEQGVYRPNYYDVTNNLANSLINYYYLQNGIADIKFSEWYMDDYTNNYVKVEYKDGDVDKVAYYDYITVKDEKGVTIGLATEEGKIADGASDPQIVVGIQILQKSVAFDENGNLIFVVYDGEDALAVYGAKGYLAPVTQKDSQGQDIDINHPVKPVEPESGTGGNGTSGTSTPGNNGTSGTSTPGSNGTSGTSTPGNNGTPSGGNSTPSETPAGNNNGPAQVQIPDENTPTAETPAGNNNKPGRPNNTPSQKPAGNNNGPAQVQIPDGDTPTAEAPAGNHSRPTQRPAAHNNAIPTGNNMAVNVQTPATANVNTDEVENIEDEMVPLAVSEENSVSDVAEVTTIEDDEVAKAAGVAADGISNTWWWLSAVAATTAGKGVVDKKSRQADKDDNETRYKEI